MSWAVRRRILYLSGIAIFFTVLIGLPLAYTYLTIPPTCVDNEMNQTETAIDRGGPCPLVDVNRLAPSSVLWTRSFKIRDGSFSATSYIQNPNDNAGIGNISYVFSLYDSQNILVAERRGQTYVMPGGITPVYESDIDTGHRIAVRAFFRFSSRGQWLHYVDTSNAVIVSDRELTNATEVPRLEARVTNTDTTARTDLTFVATVFDTAGNAFASSATKLARLEAGDSQEIVFTWPDPFTLQVGRIDIIPVSTPRKAWQAPCEIVNEQVRCAQ